MNTKGKSTLEKFESNLRFKRYADNTISIYLHYADIFLNSFNEDIYHISQAKAIKHLKGIKYSSCSHQNQYMSAIKSLYKYIVGCKLDRFNIERPRKSKSLPKVIDHDYLKLKLDSIENIKHKALLKLTYSVGLRVSDLINLKISDIDSDRMIIHIKNGKGGKDRIVPLKQPILDLLRQYYKECKPVVYLFNGQIKAQYTASSCNKIVKKYLGNQYHIHQLRHSCGTYMLENGTDISTISKMFGHENIKTTMIYTQISVNQLHNAQTPN